ncbi:hypothetical protein [Photobacterium galatheae]|uniref:Uncharacterized protein n=1 Tax=Photobacterium galatheae TaxID=1654360 RepID=A0A066RL12_9GAMM|nr:hypothetical protein [Photobacterium galatheae]KDM91034.1 hypothetical protein EA58_14900 [Photobacterium galatheae]MCM0149014.1 hypothetical protein [Photobacterium galatheae]
MTTANKTSEKQPQKTNQVTIPFRFGATTSKASLQPAIYEAILTQKNGDVKATRSFIKDLAIEACQSDDVHDVSLFVQSKALVHLMPQEIQSNIFFNPTSDGRLPIRYHNPVSKKGTKMTTLTILVDILDFLYEGSGQAIHKNFAIAVHQAKAKEAQAMKAAGLEPKRQCNVSHIVRERIINHLMSAIDA